MIQHYRRSFEVTLYYANVFGWLLLIACLYHFGVDTSELSPAERNSYALKWIGVGFAYTCVLTVILLGVYKYRTSRFRKQLEAERMAQSDDVVELTDADVLVQMSKKGWLYVVSPDSKYLTFVPDPSRKT